MEGRDRDPGPFAHASMGEAFFCVTCTPWVLLPLFVYPPILLIVGTLHLLWAARIMRRGRSNVVVWIGTFLTLIAGLALFLAAIFSFGLWRAGPL